MDAVKNFAVSTVATAPSPATSGTSLVVAAGEGTRFPATPFNASIFPAGTLPTPANAEIVRVTNISTDTLTITRAQEGTSARTVVVGDQIVAAITAKTLTDINGATSELDYVERTTSLTVTATSDATAQTWIDCNPITLDGATRIRIEIFAAYAASSAGQDTIVNLYDGSTDLGRVFLEASSASEFVPIHAVRYLTPSAGSHTFHAKAWKTGGTSSIEADVGGVGTLMPAYVRITAAAAPVTSADTGWTPAGETWTYASASTFTVSGDQTVRYGKGTRLKFTQTTDKYAVVVASSYSSGTTTVTIAVNTDYTIANAAITSPFYSYDASPQGYPGWFAYTPTWTGFSAAPTSVGKFNVIGTSCFYAVNDATGTSNSTAMTVSLPVTAAAVSTMPFQACRVQDNSLYQSSPGMIGNDTITTAATIYKNWGGGGFTGSGSKSCEFSVVYKI